MESIVYLTRDGRTGRMINQDEGTINITPDKIRRAGRTTKARLAIEASGGIVLGESTMHGLRIGRHSFQPFHIN